MKVDGNVVARHPIAHTIPLILQWDESFDIGADTGTPVDDKDYQCPFRFTGKLNRLTLNLKPTEMSAQDQQLLREKGNRHNAASE
jgi:arylsulfatase